MAASNEPFVLNVSLPKGGPSAFSDLHIMTCMADDPEMDKRDDMGMSRKVARLFNLMTCAYKLRLREKPWSVP